MKPGRCNLARRVFEGPWKSAKRNKKLQQEIACSHKKTMCDAREFVCITQLKERKVDGILRHPSLSYGIIWLLSTEWCPIGSLDMWLTRVSFAALLLKQSAQDRRIARISRVSAHWRTGEIRKRPFRKTRTYHFSLDLTPNRDELMIFECVNWILINRNLVFGFHSNHSILQAPCYDFLIK